MQRGNGQMHQMKAVHGSYEDQDAARLVKRQKIESGSTSGSTASSTSSIPSASSVSISLSSSSSSSSSTIPSSSPTSSTSSSSQTPSSKSTTTSSFTIPTTSSSVSTQPSDTTTASSRSSENRQQSTSSASTTKPAQPTTREKSTTTTTSMAPATTVSSSSSTNTSTSVIPTTSSKSSSSSSTTRISTTSAVTSLSSSASSSTSTTSSSSSSISTSSRSSSTSTASTTSTTSKTTQSTSSSSTSNASAADTSVVVVASVASASTPSAQPKSTGEIFLQDGADTSLIQASSSVSSSRPAVSSSSESINPDSAIQNKQPVTSVPAALTVAPVPAQTAAVTSHGIALAASVPSITGSGVLTGTFVPATDLPGGASIAPSGTQGGSPSASADPAAASAAASNSSTAAVVSQQSATTQMPTAVVAGSAVGGAVALGLLAVLLFLWRKRRTNAARSSILSEPLPPKRRSPYGRFSTRHLSAHMPSLPVSARVRSNSIPEPRSPPMVESYGAEAESFRQRALTSPNRPVLPPIPQNNLEPFTFPAMSSMGIVSPAKSQPGQDGLSGIAISRDSGLVANNAAPASAGLATIVPMGAASTAMAQHSRSNSFARTFSIAPTVPEETNPFVIRAAKHSAQNSWQNSFRSGGRGDSIYSDRSSGIMVPSESTASIISLPSVQASEPPTAGIRQQNPFLHARSISEADLPPPTAGSVLPSAGPLGAWRDSMWSVQPTPIEPLTAFSRAFPPTARLPPVANNARAPNHRYSRSSSYVSTSADSKYASAQRTVDSWIAHNQMGQIAPSGTTSVYSVSEDDADAPPMPPPPEGIWGVKTRLPVNATVQVLTPAMPPLSFIQKQVIDQQQAPAQEQSNGVASNGPPAAVGHAFHMRYANARGNDVPVSDTGADDTGSKKGHSRNISEMSAFRVHPGDRVVLGSGGVN